MERVLPNVEDLYQWSRQTAEALKTGNLSTVNVDALIDELESTANGLKRDLTRYFEAAVKAKLELKYTTADRRQTRDTLFDAYNNIASLLWACPSLAEFITDHFIAEVYQWAKKLAEAYYENTLPAPLPDKCPFALQDIRREIDTLEIAA